MDKDSMIKSLEELRNSCDSKTEDIVIQTWLFFSCRLGGISPRRAMQKVSVWVETGQTEVGKSDWVNE